MSLGPNDVHVWYTDPESVTDRGILEWCHTILSAEERARHGRFLVDRPRHEYLIAHALVRGVLSRYAAVAPSAWQFRSSTSGKPEIDGPKGVPRLRFNLSHTRGLCVCAVTLNRVVGVDAETLDRSVSAALQTSCVSAAEAAMLQRVPDLLRSVRFLELWTLKEAYVKARGIGLTVPASAVSFHTAAGSAIEVAFGPEVSDDPGAWQFFQFHPHRHALAVAVRQPPSSRLELAAWEDKGLRLVAGRDSFD